MSRTCKQIIDHIDRETCPECIGRAAGLFSAGRWLARHACGRIPASPGSPTRLRSVESTTDALRPQRTRPAPHGQVIYIGLAVLIGVGLVGFGVGGGSGGGGILNALTRTKVAPKASFADRSRNTRI